MEHRKRNGYRALSLVQVFIPHFAEVFIVNEPRSGNRSDQKIPTRRYPVVLSTSAVAVKEKSKRGEKAVIVGDTLLHLKHGEAGELSSLSLTIAEWRRWTPL